MECLSIIKLYPYFENLLGYESPIALGGYTSLVRQGIIKDSRNTKDIDLCLFYDTDTEPGKMIISTAVDNSRVWNNFINKSGGEDTFYVDAKKGKSFSNDFFSMEQEAALKRSIGIDKHCTLSIALNRNIHKIRKDAEREKRVNEAKKSDEGTATPELSGYRFSVSGLSDTSWTVTSMPTSTDGVRYTRYKANYDNNIFTELENAASKRREKDVHEKEIIHKIRSSYILHAPIMFGNMLSKMPDNQMDFDLFYMDINKVGKTTVMIDDIRYVHYYTILKAKYEYCVNKDTNEEGFKKHIEDLINSYDKVHILGVNSPKDIDLLIKNRNDKE